MSNSVAKALQLTSGPKTGKMIEFVDMFDKLFDCLNVSNFSAAKHSRKAFKAPYHSGDDFRLKVLKQYNNFLFYNYIALLISG